MVGGRAEVMGTTSNDDDPEDLEDVEVPPAEGEHGGEDRYRLIQRYTPLVKMVAGKMARRLPPHVELDDLIGAGMIGLIDAVDKFDRSRAQNLKSYAEIRIKGAILDELRSLDHATRTHRRQSAELDRASREVEAERGRAASDEEVAERLQISVEEYRDLMEKLRPVMLVSLEDLGAGSDEEDRGGALQFLEDPTAANPRDVAHLKRLREVVTETIEGLGDRRRSIVNLYYYDGLTLKEIGRLLDVTESRVSQLLTETVRTLRKRVRARLGNASDAGPEI